MAEAVPKRVMVVEDEAVIALLLSSHLMKWGYDVVGTADNFEEAVELFDAEQPDLVLMDVSIMGPRDGVETAHALRERRPELPIIFLSAYADQATSRRIRDSAPHGYLPKPFDASALEQKVRELLSSPSAP